MALTREFRETVKARAERDPVFRAGLYAEAIGHLVEGDLATARILLRDTINATIGFSALAERIGLPDKSVQRMFGPNGNPTAQNLVAVLNALREDGRLAVTIDAAVTTPSPARSRGRRTDTEPLRKPIPV